MGDKDIISLWFGIFKTCVIFLKRLSRITSIFLKRVRRKVNQCSAVLLVAMVMCCSLVLWLTSSSLTTSLIITRSETEETHFLIDKLPQPPPSWPLTTQHFQPGPICPTCAPCPKPRASDAHRIKCSVPSSKDTRDIECLQRRDEVYMPVSFINSFFEVYGEMKSDTAEPRYDFRYSYGSMYNIQTSYHPAGLFLNFEHYHVERRNRILCISAIEGVPLANQWKEDGYYYAISVAQYGISHHAKALINGNPTPRVVTGIVEWEDVESESIVEMKSVDVKGHQRRVLFFLSNPSIGGKGPCLNVNSENSSLSLDVYLQGEGRITVKIAKRDGSLGYVHYDNKNRVWDVDPNGHVSYGMGRGKESKWVHLVRDIATDWNKAFSTIRVNGPDSFHHIVDISLHGTGYLDNVTIAQSFHLEHLLQAADWLVSYQDSKGGWPTDFEIKTGPIHLKSGWYSAMAQGQAMSTLVRAYNITGSGHYLEAAVKALYLFNISSKDGGVKTQFLHHLDWYEEYPTTPYGTFVLNGFIFSLLGLYDVMETVRGEGQTFAKTLWDSGLRSLKSMIGMFDSGAGTFYDLRHVVYHDQPNRARWDYHLVHISLIQEMAIVDGDPLFHSTAERWVGYLKGKRSKHN